MNCPQCNISNSDNAVKCENCGNKLKIACPKCKVINNINAVKCTNCSFRLIYPCPSCKKPYQISAKQCSTCGFEVLKACPECKAMNLYTKIKCNKCGFNLCEDQPIVQEVQPSSSVEPIQEYPILTAELINILSIKDKVKNPVVLTKILNGFYKIIGLNADISGSTAKKIKENIVSFSFNDYGDGETSSISAVYTAIKILSDIKEYNYKIKDKVKLSLKIKIGISMQNIMDKSDYSQIERSLASFEDIIIDRKIYNSVYESFEFDAIKGADGQYYYKLKQLDDISVEGSQDLPHEEATPLIIENEPIIENQQEQVSLEEPVEEVPYEEITLQEYNEQAPVNDIIEEENVQQVEELIQPQAEQLPVESSNEKELNQEKTFNFLSNIIQKADNGFIIQLTAQNGAGKSSIVNSVRNSLTQEKILWLTGQCQPFNQIVPFGLMKDLFKNLFNLPSQIINIEEAKKSINHTIQNIMEIDNKAIEHSIAKLVLSDNIVERTDINANLYEVYNTIESIFNVISNKLKCVLIIEDFEYIDKSSLDCLKFLIGRGLLNNKFHIIINQVPEVNAKDQLMNMGIDNRIFTIKLLPLQPDETLQTMMSMLNGQDIIPTKLKNKIIEKAKGIPLYVEQVFWILYNSGAIVRDGEAYKFNPEASAIDIPETIEELIQLRIGQIHSLSASAFNILTMSSILGYKFIPVIAQNITNMKAEEFSHILQTLGTMGIFVQADKLNISFKHKLIWDACYQTLLTLPQKSEYFTQAYNILKNYTKTSSAMLALIAESSNNNREALNQWGGASQESIVLGDSETFTKAQQRALSLIDMTDIPEKEAIKNNIYEQLGVINFEINPQEATTYLSNAIIQGEKDNNIPKIIELSGYLAKSCEIIGNYAGSVECSDKALALLNKDQMPLDYALLNYSKIEPLVNLGKLEEAIILTSHDVLPILHQAFENKSTISGLSMSELTYIMLESELLLGKALVYQGNKNALNVLQSTASKAVELEVVDIEVQARLFEAIYKTIQGDTKSSNAMLEYLKTIIPKVKNKNTIKIYWGAANLLLQFIEGNANEASNIAFTLLTMAQEQKDYNIEALAKFMIGKLLKDARNYENANTMFNDTIQYCSEHKLATGALMGWYLIAESKLTLGDLDNALEIATKALDVATKSNINNHLFKVLLNKVMSEVYILKGDFENSKMYIEQAIELATHMELFFLISKLYMAYGKTYQEYAISSEHNRQNFVHNAHSLYITALQTAERIDNEQLIAQVNKEIIDLETFCQLSGIQIS